MSQQQEPKRLGYIERKLDDLAAALFGNKKIDANDRGVIGDIQEDVHDLKKTVHSLAEKIEKNAHIQIKYNVYTVIMWIALGAVAMAIFNLWLTKK